MPAINDALKHQLSTDHPFASRLGAQADFKGVPVSDPAQVSAVVEKFRDQYGDSCRFQISLSLPNRVTAQLPSRRLKELS
jgi:hypothetical protein